ncbi:MAG: lipid A deacylase LpxR family protein [Granulosicoccus sp.]
MSPARWVQLLMMASCLSMATLPSANAAQQVFSELPTTLDRTTTLVFENDIFTGQDSGYTNGVALLFSKGTFPTFSADVVPDLVARVVRGSWIAKTDQRKRGLVYTIAQGMQTPEDITVTSLQSDQPPYAGVLLGSLSLYAFDHQMVDQLSFSLGVVGPVSLAEQAQRLIHTATGSDDPAGWDNQLHNELVFQLEASRGYRLAATRLGTGPELDLIAHGSAALGTLASHASVSLIARIGRELALTFPVATLLPNRQINANVFSSKPSWFGFVGAESQYLANDILIDGNTFRDSHSLSLDHTRERLSIGLSFSVGRFGLTFLYADVPGNSDEDPFGAVSVTYK